MLGVMRKSASTDRLATAAAAAAAMTPPLPPAKQSSSMAARQQRRLALRFRGCRLGMPVPSEMWGAAALAARMAQPSVQPHHLQRAASAVIAQAFSSASAVPPSGHVSEDHPKALAEALEWRPKLSAAEDAASLLGPAAICAGVYAATAPATLQPAYAAGMALLYGLLILCTRMLLMERRYRAVQRSERELAAADSRFFEMDGIQLHYKRRTPAAPPGSTSLRGAGTSALVHCLHGFGASSYSWSFVQQELADELQAVVTAHDMPGFGLSQRPRCPSYYTLHFNGDAARQMLDAELAKQAQQAQQQGGHASHPLSHSASAGSLGSSGDGGGEGAAAAAAAGQPPKLVLVGHSMGGAAAAESLIAAPLGVAALVLVAPAIVALWLGPPDESAGDPIARGLAVVEELVGADDPPGAVGGWPAVSSSSSSASTSARSSSSPQLSRSGSSSSSSSAAAASTSSSRGRKLSVLGRVQRTARAAAAVLKAVLLLAVRVVLTALSPVLVLVLRRLIRSRRFWERGLASAWHDGSRVSPEYVDAYRSGQLVRGWEGGILRFLAARFAEKGGFWATVTEAVRGKGHLTQAERLAATIRRHNIRVLILHGSSDALVPAANSRRLAALLPNAELVVFEGCGHMPQEECPERFVEAVRTFVQSLD